MLRNVSQVNKSISHVEAFALTSQVVALVLERTVSAIDHHACLPMYSRLAVPSRVAVHRAVTCVGYGAPYKRNSTGVDCVVFLVPFLAFTMKTK